jgi:hypothetical protein
MFEQNIIMIVFTLLLMKEIGTKWRKKARIDEVIGGMAIYPLER